MIGHDISATGKAVQTENVHAWFMEIPKIWDHLSEEAFLGVLSPPELNRYGGMSAEGRKKSYLLGHALARIQASKLMGCALEKCGLVFEEKGKPQFKNENWYVSISHSNSFIYCGIAQVPIGIDGEGVREKGSEEKLAQRYYSSEENKRLCVLNKVDQIRYFYAIWSIKEAFYKACNLGLMAVFSQFTLDEIKPECWKLKPAQKDVWDEASIQIESGLVHPSERASIVALTKKPIEVCWMEIKADELMDQYEVFT